MTIPRIIAATGAGALLACGGGGAATPATPTGNVAPEPRSTGALEDLPDHPSPEGKMEWANRLVGTISGCEDGSHLEASVELRIRVGGSGAVEEVQLQRPTGRSDIDACIIEAVRGVAAEPSRDGFEVTHQQLVR